MPLFAALKDLSELPIRVYTALRTPELARTSKCCVDSVSSGCLESSSREDHKVHGERTLAVSSGAHREGV